MKITIAALTLFASFSFVGMAHAVEIPFNFNSLAHNAANGTIQGYMQGLLPGTTITGAVASKKYTGDNHVVGPCNLVNCGPDALITPITLGTTDGAVGNNTDVPRAGAGRLQGGAVGTNDTFLLTSGQVQGAKITITFPSPVSLVSFDWEIFPDASCAQTPCPSLPDFTFKINGAQVAFYTGVVPGQSGVAPNYVTGGPTHLHSVASGRINNEPGPQLIGIYTTAADNVTKLEFIDWPVEIGIDNLIIRTPNPPTQVPLPHGLALVGAGAFAAAVLMRVRACKGARADAHRAVRPFYSRI